MNLELSMINLWDYGLVKCSIGTMVYGLERLGIVGLNMVLNVNFVDGINKRLHQRR